MSNDPNLSLLRRSIRWRVAAGWVIVAILIWRYIAHPAWSTYLITTGNPPLPDLAPFNLADVGVLVGLPVGGALADNMASDD